MIHTKGKIILTEFYKYECKKPTVNYEGLPSLLFLIVLT